MTTKSNLIDDLLRFFYILVVAYFLEPPCISTLHQSNAKSCIVYFNT